MPRLKPSAGLATATYVLAAVFSAPAAFAAPEPLEPPPMERPAASGLKLATKKMPHAPAADQSAPATPSTPSESGTTTVPPAPSTSPPSAAELSSPTKRTLSDCMKLWDKDTHMTKADWKATCIRSQKEADKHEAIVARERKAMEREKEKK